MTKELSHIAGSGPVYSLDEVQKMATAIVQGGLFPHLKSPQAALSLMLLCQAEGLHPMHAVQRYHVVQGRPVMRADAMLAAFQQAGGRVEWHKRDNAAVAATFSHPSGGSCRVEWTIEQAKSAGLTGKEVWRQYPRQMLTARVISEGIRTVYPGVCMGIYTPEEVEDFDTRAVSPAPAPLLIEPTNQQINERTADNGGRGRVVEALPSRGAYDVPISAPQRNLLGKLAYPGSAAGWPSRKTMTKAQASVLIDYYDRHQTWEGAPGDPGTTTEAIEIPLDVVTNAYGEDELS